MFACLEYFAVVYLIVAFNKLMETIIKLMLTISLANFKIFKCDSAETERFNKNDKIANKS